MSNFPIASFYFSVEIDGVDIAFQDISGINAEFDVDEIVDGHNNGFMRKIPKRMKFTPVVLKKGICKTESMKSLLRTIVNQDYNLYDHVTSFRKNIYIFLKDEKGNNVMTFELIEAFPIKLNFGKFNSQENNIAIEELSYVYRNLNLKYDDRD